MPKTRLDALLVQRGLFETRSRAAAAVLAGTVRMGEDGLRAEKPGQLVFQDVVLRIDSAPPYVSRGGAKLAGVLDAFAIDPHGRRCLDVGASTGGFTDCLLQRDAAHVVACDVAYGQLNWRIRNDARVTVLERCNARGLAPRVLPYAPDLITIDVSFISLGKVLPAVLGCAAGRFDCLALVKPQFEVGRERVGKGGVVRGVDDRREAILGVAQGAADDGWAVLGLSPSRLTGPAGNRETFVWIAEKDRADAGIDREVEVGRVDA